MVLVGTLAGVAAVIAGYPVYGGQALRYAAAAVILLAVASARRTPPARLTPRDVLLLAALAAVGMVGFNVCVIEATRAASPAMVGTVVGAVPVALAIAGPVLSGSAGGRRPSARVVAAAGVIVAGAALTTGLGTGSLRGLAFASGALACEAGFSLLAMPLLPKLGPLRVSGYAAAAAVPMALAAAAIADGPGMLRVPTTAEAAGLAYLAVVVSAGAFVLWYAALARLGADRAGLLAGVVPIGAIATTVTLGLGHPTGADLAGAALVTAGLLLGLAPARRRTPAPGPSPAPRPHRQQHPRHHDDQPGSNPQQSPGPGSRETGCPPSPRSLPEALDAAPRQPAKAIRSTPQRLQDRILAATLLAAELDDLRAVSSAAGSPGACAYSAQNVQAASPASVYPP
jgi:drug/metabolite transporter (DMT)-like permease